MLATNRVIENKKREISLYTNYLRWGFQLSDETCYQIILINIIHEISKWLTSIDEIVTAIPFVTNRIFATKICRSYRL